MILMAWSRALKMIVEAFEDVDALPQLPQLVLEPLADGREAEVEEVPEDVLEAQAVLRHQRGAVRPGHERRHVVRDRLLQFGVLVEIGHHQVRVGVRA